MKFEFLIFALTIFFIVNTYYDGKYVKILKSWKKYYQMGGIAFAGISAYAFIKKYPSQSQSLLQNANGIIKFMPIDKEAGDLLSPLLNIYNFAFFKQVIISQKSFVTGKLIILMYK